MLDRHPVLSARHDRVERNRDPHLDVGALGYPDLTIGEDRSFKSAVDMHIAGENEVATDEALRSQLRPHDLRLRERVGGEI